MRKLSGFLAVLLIGGSFGWLFANFDEPFVNRLWAGLVFICLIALGLMCCSWHEKCQPATEVENPAGTEFPVKAKPRDGQMSGMQLLDAIMFLVIGALGAMAQIIGNNGGHSLLGQSGFEMAFVYILVRPAIARVTRSKRLSHRRHRPTRVPLYSRTPEA